MLVDKAGKLLAACASHDIPDDIEVIGAGAFAGSTIEEITLPKYVHTIQLGAFERGNPHKVKWNDLVQEISTIAFSECPNLHHFDFAPCIRKIDNCAFYSTPLKKLILNESLREVEEYAFDFMERNSPIKIVLPESLITIYGTSFNKATKLEDNQIFARGSKPGPEWIFPTGRATNKSAQKWMLEHITFNYSEE